MRHWPEVVEGETVVDRQALQNNYQLASQITLRTVDYTGLAIIDKIYPGNLRFCMVKTLEKNHLLLLRTRHGLSHAQAKLVRFIQHLHVAPKLISAGAGLSRNFSHRKIRMAYETKCRVLAIMLQIYVASQSSHELCVLEFSRPLTKFSSVASGCRTIPFQPLIRSTYFLPNFYSSLHSSILLHDYSSVIICHSSILQ